MEIRYGRATVSGDESRCNATGHDVWEGREEDEPRVRRPAMRTHKKPSFAVRGGGKMFKFAYQDHVSGFS